MPVWVSTDASIDHNKAGKQRRHISDACPIYMNEVPQASRTVPKGRPNTVALQEKTDRCEHPDCWEAWEREQATKKTRGKGGVKTSTKGAATVPAKQVGGKAADIAAKAKAARQKPVAAGATA